MLKSSGSKRSALFLRVLPLACAFSLSPTCVYADADQDAISQSLQNQLQARQKQWAQYEADQGIGQPAVAPAPIAPATPAHEPYYYQPPVTAAVAAPAPAQMDPLPARSISPAPMVAEAVPPQVDPSALSAMQAQIDALKQQLSQMQQASPAAGVQLPTGVPVATPGTPASTPANASISHYDYGEQSLKQVGQTTIQPSRYEPTVDTSNLHSIIKSKTNIDMTLGGFLALMSIYRDKNEASDAASNFNANIPFTNAANAHQSEWRETARGSRVSLKAVGTPSSEVTLTGYGEADWASAAPTSNNTITNGFTPRLRQAFLAYDDTGWGMHFLAGQAYSLVTQNRVGIVPLQENTPILLDPGFMPGFNYTRNPQVRLAGDFDNHKVWVALSAENPQAITTGLPCTANATTGTCTGFNSNIMLSTAPNAASFSGNLSTDIAPDFVLKTAYDPGWGHYEIFGIARFFHETTGANFHNAVYMGEGAGASAILPVVPSKLDLQAQFMAGNGIGRYGPTQMPDFAVAPDGALKPIPEYTTMLGAVAHPVPRWDAFLYFGQEKAFRENVNNAAYGYGDFSVSNNGCYALSGTCTASTSSVWEVTSGTWHRFYDGDYGRMQVGLQDSLIRRNAFADSRGNAPHAYNEILQLSFVYFPF